MKRVAIGFLFLVQVLSASAQPVRNLAYEGQFVWYLSGRLAHELVVYQKKLGLKFEDAEWNEHRLQYEMLYHHFLVDCNGPLPNIAEAVRFFDPSIHPDRPHAVLAYVGSMEYQIWPTVQEWNVKILFPLLAAYSKGQYAPLPECVVAGYREQNPIPK